MSEIKQYMTIDAPNSAEITEKGSKFIAYLYQIKDITEIKSEINRIKNLNPKAKHWCYAWRLGIHGDLYKASDDGEPSGTAGKPILNQIDSMNLTNVLLIVVRYFGGILLGTSGLIKAYKEVSKKCIAHSTLIKLNAQLTYHITSSITKIQTLIGILKELEIFILDYSIEETSFILFKLPLENEDFYFRKIKSKLEKTNMNQLANPKQLNDCIITLSND